MVQINYSTENWQKWSCILAYVWSHNIKFILSNLLLFFFFFSDYYLNYLLVSIVHYYLHLLPAVAAAASKKKTKQKQKQKTKTKTKQKQNKKKMGGKEKFLVETKK